MRGNRSAVLAPPGAGLGWARSVGSSLLVAAVGCPLVPASGFRHLPLGYVGPKAVLLSGSLQALVTTCLLGLLLCFVYIVHIFNRLLHSVGMGKEGHS